jgi:hypothetical protein
VKTSPALAWTKNNAPKEHYDALCDALQHREIVETDAAMYGIIRKERDNLKKELEVLKKNVEDQQDDHK